MKLLTPRVCRWSRRLSLFAAAASCVGCVFLSLRHQPLYCFLPLYCPVPVPLGTVLLLEPLTVFICCCGVLVCVLSLCPLPLYCFPLYCFPALLPCFYLILVLSEHGPICVEICSYYNFCIHVFIRAVRRKYVRMSPIAST